MEPNQIGIDSLEGAIELVDYFISNIGKVRGSFGTSALDKQIDKIVAWLKQPKQNGTTNSRKVYSNRVAGVKNAQEVYEIFMEMRSRHLGVVHMQSDGLGGPQKGYQFVLDKNLLNNPQKPTNNG